MEVWLRFLFGYCIKRVEIRPSINANFLNNLFGENKKHISHLDFGGGNGRCSEMLNEIGFKSESYDYFVNDKIIEPINQIKKYNLITAFEVFEHHKNPNELFCSLRNLLSDDGIIIFSTLLSDGHIDNGKRLEWWYASPRNGHISLFSKKSLFFIANKYKLKLVSFNQGLHILFKDSLPHWANKIQIRTI